MSYLTIDAGTGSIRAILFSSTGELQGVVQQKWDHPRSKEWSGGIDFDYASNRELVVALLRDLVLNYPEECRTIEAVSSASMREAFVLLDEAGNEIWACSNVDARAVDESRELTNTDGLQYEVYLQSGETFALAAQPRLLWVSRHLPEVWAKARYMLTISDWILYVLSGKMVGEPTNLSTTGLLGLRDRDFNQALLEACGLVKDLSVPVVEPGTVLGTLSAELAQEVGLSTEIKVVAGGGDTQLGALGAGVTKVSDAVIVGGTFWQTVVNIGKPECDKEMQIRVNCGVEAGVWQAEAIAFHIGTMMEWFKKNFSSCLPSDCDDIFAYFEPQATQLEPGSSGLVAVTSDAMNFGRWRHASPSFVDIPIFDCDVPFPVLAYRALMEAAAYATAENLRRIEAFTGVECENLTFVGGASKSKLWRQILADVLGRELLVPQVSEATALGGAMCCAVGVGAYGSLSEVASAWVTSASKTTPDAKAHLVYKDLLARWRAIYEKQLQLVDEGSTRSLWAAANS